MLWRSQRRSQTIFGLKPGDVYWAASDVGWVVGHSYIVYAPLLAGLTTVMYEGKPVGTPDAAAFWRRDRAAPGHVLFTAPTAIRAIRRQDADLDLRHNTTCPRSGRFSWPASAATHRPRSGCRSTWTGPSSTTGGRPRPAGRSHARFRGAELTPFKPGSGGRPSPGFEIRALADDSGTALPAGATGNLALRLPLPPGCAPTLWEDDEGYSASYLEDFPGWYRTGDAGHVDEDGDVWVLGPNRRHHQRGWAPLLHGRDGGGPGRAS